MPRMQIPDLEDWLNNSMSREHSGVYDDLKLEPVKRILSDLHISVRPITVAGTKGKGSTVRFIESGLLAAGKTCLAFTSPHVNDINERWRIHGKSADDATLCAAAEAITASEAACAVQLTYFERCFVIAAYLAHTLSLDYFLCEVGLGGRLDCANALDTQLAIVTSISKDHCKVLGDTLELISAEKLAIARADAPLIIGPQSPAAHAAIEAQLPPAQSITWITTDTTLQLQLRGAHQQGNASTAVHALTQLGITITDAVHDAICNAQLPARCELLQLGERRILIDAAHNGASISACMAVARDCLAPNFQIIIGSMVDKQLHDICAALDTERIIVRSAFNWPRACGEADWPDVAQAWPFYPHISAALDALDPAIDVCICGSFYLAGEARALLNNR